MYKIAAICLGAIFVSGCSVTTTSTYRTPIGPSVYNLPSAHPAYYQHPPQYRNSYRYHNRVNCYSVWDRTPRGMIERKVCTR
jgi:hypothetical protein